MVAPVFDSSSLPLVEEMFAKYRADAGSVAPEWQAYFAGWLAAGEVTTGSGSEAGDGLPVAVSTLIEAWRSRGWRVARTNPLLSDAPAPQGELMLQTYGIGQDKLDKQVQSDGVVPGAVAPLREIFAKLQQIYGGTVGVESGHIGDAEERAWVRAWWENPANQGVPEAAVRRRLYTGLVRANAFERFLHTKFVGVKRFSIEGCDALVPLLREVAEWVAGDGAEGMPHMVLGMAHRGRLNVLCNVLHKPLVEMLAGFSDTLTQEGGPSSGDVKYHLGKTYVEHTDSGEVELQLLFNPSHLEAVNPLVLGVAKAIQMQTEAAPEVRWKKALPVLVHGDSAVIGQGTVAECNNLMKLAGYGVGGTLHIVANNQVGFTADPVDAFSGEACTDGFRGFGMPIVHVSADDVEACWRAMRFAYAYRQRFAKDVVVDVVGYRRWGHNEGDDPTFTQPVMYRAIKDHPVAAEVYLPTLLKDGVVDENAAKIIQQTYTDELNKALAEAQGGITTKAKGTAAKSGVTRTAVSKAALAAVAEAWEHVPAGAEINAKVKKVLDERVAGLRGNASLNWGAAETAAYGTLLREGIGWRLTGQDVQRGTFSHRHAVMTQTDGKKWAPLAALRTGAARHEVFNSALSENAVLGFEYGYALTDKNTLVMWEGQFGDFANGAQVVIDQFIAAAEAKWGQQNHVTLLLPHGYEGQGPEHSSARLERYLQLCAEDNLRVVVPSTPAQTFHLLRRQALLAAQGGACKPLIVMTPKSLLRHPLAVSELKDLTDGAFMPVIEDSVIDAKKAKKIVLCSGKIYYDLLAARDEKKADVALIRVEQLYPWPQAELDKALEGIKARDVHWVQEEPRNMGAALHVREYWDADWGYLHIVSRPAAASPAVGTTKRHLAEQAAIVSEVVGK